MVVIRCDPLLIYLLFNLISFKNVMTEDSYEYDETLDDERLSDMEQLESMVESIVDITAKAFGRPGLPKKQKKVPQPIQEHALPVKNGTKTLHCEFCKGFGLKQKCLKSSCGSTFDTCFKTDYLNYTASAPDMQVSKSCASLDRIASQYPKAKNATCVENVIKNGNNYTLTLTCLCNNINYCNYAATCSPS